MLCLSLKQMWFPFLHLKCCGTTFVLAVRLNIHVRGVRMQHIQGHKFTKNTNTHHLRGISVLPSFDPSISQINSQTIRSNCRFQIRVLHLAPTPTAPFLPAFPRPPHHPTSFRDLVSLESLSYHSNSISFLVMCHIHDENKSQYGVMIGAEIPPMRRCYTTYSVCRFPGGGGTILPGF
jgi:hypothetical protein